MGDDTTCCEPPVKCSTFYTATMCPTGKLAPNQCSLDCGSIPCEDNARNDVRCCEAFCVSPTVDGYTISSEFVPRHGFNPIIECASDKNSDYTATVCEVSGLEYTVTG